MMHPDWIEPDWPAPARVKALMTTRAGGSSKPPYDSFNPAGHVGDDPLAVAENRHRLRQSLPSDPFWINQAHGTGVAQFGVTLSEADASVAFESNQVCAVLTADCLPVLLCDRSGAVVAAAHAGWRGLAAGVLEASVQAMGVPPQDVMAWLGVAIGPSVFEVGAEVRDAFIAVHARAAGAFIPAPGLNTTKKYLADIYALARCRLASAGVSRTFGGGLCTYTDRARYFSYRRDGHTGRMASLIWLEDE